MSNSPTQENDKEGESDQKDNTKLANKGKLQINAIIADAPIKFPTDLSLLNNAREKS